MKNDEQLAHDFCQLRHCSYAGNLERKDGRINFDLRNDSDRWSASIHPDDSGDWMMINIQSLVKRGA